MYKSVAYLVKSIPKYIIHFDTIVNGIFLISFSACLMLMYSNAVDFYVVYFISYNFAEFITYNSLMESLGFSIHRIQKSANKER